MSNFQGFSKLKFEERLEKLVNTGFLNSKDIEFLKSKTEFKIDLAENFIENAIGYFHLPLGVATHFVIDGEKYVIPMAVEETSIIAAVSKTAKWLAQNKSEITTTIIGSAHIGQVQISEVKDLVKLKIFIEEKEQQLINDLNQGVVKGLFRRGGGVRRIFLRTINKPSGDTMGVIHVEIDTCDAMGANIINQAVESLKTVIEEQTCEQVSVCILSNLVDTKVTKAHVRIKNLPSDLCKKIEEASLFAELDPYRACTHNKGVLNGIDPVLVATGNDWRAVEAGVHAYAARNGSYQPITKWSEESKGVLVGEFEAPVIVGTVGGVTRLHPTAQMCLNMLKVKTSSHLSRICAAVGLVQNLGALKALVTKGIIQGHMRLHIKNLALAAEATKQETLGLVQELEKILDSEKKVSLNDAVKSLEKIRDKKEGRLLKEDFSSPVKPL